VSCRSDQPLSASSPFMLIGDNFDPSDEIGR